MPARAPALRRTACRREAGPVRDRGEPWWCRRSADFAAVSVAIASAAYDGLGIPACLASAEVAVDQVQAYAASYPVIGMSETCCAVGHEHPAQPGPLRGAPR
jgi:hypothetical protein